jgi:hypothetical protein
MAGRIELLSVVADVGAVDEYTIRTPQRLTLSRSTLPFVAAKPCGARTRTVFCHNGDVENSPGRRKSPWYFQMKYFSLGTVTTGGNGKTFKHASSVRAALSIGRIWQKSAQ